MKKNFYSFVFLFGLATIYSWAQFPNPALVGYWHNWSDWSAPYIDLTDVDDRYNIINVSFATPQTGTDYQMEFAPDQVTQATLIAQIQTLQSQGKIVNISVGGANAIVALDNTTERDAFINTMTDIINTYGFDGMDIDLEGSSVSITGGTISTPVDAKIINLIEATKQIMLNFRVNNNNKKMYLSMAPETAFVQGGMSAFGGIWGSYLPIIHALSDSLDVLHVQLYNSGSMFGIDGNIYNQGTADFIIAMTEAVIQGFNTSGGFFTGLPPTKVAVGLPACPNAAGGGFTNTTTVASAINYLKNEGPKPGTYTLENTNGYPNLRGLMTWSINWDAIATCNATNYEYAQNYEALFPECTFEVALSGNNTVCANTPETYNAGSYPAGTIFNWVITNGTIVTGCGTTDATCTVLWQSGTAGELSVIVQTP